MKNTDIENLVAKIRQIAYDLHVYLGNGFLEKVYANGLVHRLRKAGFLVEVQKPLRVFDSDGFCLGEYFADLVVEGLVVVELKAVQSIANEHYAQILEALAKPGRGNVLVAHTAANRGQRGRCPSHARGFASAS